MEPTPHYTRVGLFVLGCIAILIVAISWIQGAFSTSPTLEYLVMFRQQSLDGLQKDSVVSMKGIKVGTVKDYRILEEDIESVQVVLRLDSDVPIKENTRATIKRNLLTGLAKIDLTGGTQESPRLRSDTHDVLPVIQEEIPELNRLADSLPALITKIETILGQTTKVFSDANIKNINLAISSGATFAQALGRSGPQLEQSITRLESILAILDRSLQSASAENLENAISDLSGSAKELKSLLKEFREVTSSLNPLLTTTSRTAQNIDSNIQSMSDFLTFFLDQYSHINELLSEQGSTEKLSEAPPANSTNSQ